MYKRAISSKDKKKLNTSSNKNKIVDYRSFIENNSDMTKILFSYLRNNGVLLQLKNAGALNILMSEKEIDYFVDKTREISTQIKDSINE